MKELSNNKILKEGNNMYFVKLNNKKITKAAFKSGFESYEKARTALRTLLKSLGLPRSGYAELGYSITK